MKIVPKPLTSVLFFLLRRKNYPVIYNCQAAECPPTKGGGCIEAPHFGTYLKNGKIWNLIPNFSIFLPYDSKRH